MSRITHPLVRIANVIVKSVRVVTASARTALTLSKVYWSVLSMGEADIAVILQRLDHIEATLRQVHEEVRKTNGRVTELEMEEARWQGAQEGKQMQQVILTSVLSGGILAGVIWGVTYLAR